MNRKRSQFEFSSYLTFNNHPQEFRLSNDCTNTNKISDYELTSRVGEGSYGVVFRARHRKNKKTYAIKRMKLMESFNSHLREINALRRLKKHENIVHLSEIVTGEGDMFDVTYLVLDFCLQDLAVILDKHDKENPAFLMPAVKNLAKQLFTGLEYMHSNHIIHRDIKCSNILLAEGGVLKISDFGLTRRINNVEPSTPGVVTLWYRSPELIYSIKNNIQTGAVDAWAAACVVCELIQNSVLFKSKGELDLISMHIKLLGSPDKQSWPEFSTQAISIKPQPYNRLSSKFLFLTKSAIDLLTGLLTYNPKKRMTMREALDFEDFWVSKPLACDNYLIPTFPELRQTYDVDDRHFDRE